MFRYVHLLTTANGRNVRRIDNEDDNDEDLNPWLCEPSHKLVLITTYPMSGGYFHSILHSSGKNAEVNLFVVLNKILVRNFPPDCALMRLAKRIIHL